MKILLTISLILALAFAPQLSFAQPPTMDLHAFNEFLQDNRGKVIVIDFWATWCGPCRKKLPELKKCRDLFSEEELVLIGISLDFNPQTLAEYLQENSLNYPVFWADENLAAQLEVQAIPLLHMYDIAGNLRIVEEGLTPHDTLCKNIDTLTGNP